MPRTNEYGQYILSAGEIASYVVCPEAWRLKNLEKVSAAFQKNVKTGHELHKEWTENLDEAFYFTKGSKLILLLIGIAVVVFFLTWRG